MYSLFARTNSPSNAGLTDQVPTPQVSGMQRSLQVKNNFRKTLDLE